MISLLEKWMPPFVSLLFYRKRKRERHSDTAPYLHCGMVIYVVIIINACDKCYSENSLNTKKCQRCLQPVKIRDSCLRLIIQNLTCAQLSLVMCKRSRNVRARILQHLGRRVSHHPPHFPWPRVRDWEATGDESATNPGTYNLRFFEDLNISCSYQWFTETDVSWCRVYLRHFYLFIALRQNQFAVLRDLWCCELVLVIYCYWTTTVWLIKGQGNTTLPPRPPKKSIVGFLKSSSMCSRKCFRSG